MIDISVVIPVFRNRDSLNDLYSRLTLGLQDHEYEIIFVDDACPENSLVVLRNIEADDPHVVIRSHPKKYGQHRAVLTGLHVAHGQWAVVLDADLQDPPESIPDLLSKAQEGFNVVFAGRYGRYESVFRHWTSRISPQCVRIL